MPLPTISLSTSLKPPAALSRGSSNTWNSSPRTQKAGQCRRNSAARVTARSSSRPAARFTATTASGSLSFTSFVERGSCAPALFANATAELDPINLNFSPIVAREATARPSALGGCHRDDPAQLRKEYCACFFWPGLGAKSWASPSMAANQVRPLLILETFGLRDEDRAELLHILLSARESRIDKGRGCPRSVAYPFDSDLQPWSSKSRGEEKRQTSSTKAGKSCSNARALGDEDGN